MIVKNSSTRRALRTLFQVVIAAAVVVLAVVPGLHLSAGPAAKVAGLMVAAATVVTKLQNWLEDAGKLAPFLYPKEAPAIEELAADAAAVQPAAQQLATAASHIATVVQSDLQATPTAPAVLAQAGTLAADVTAIGAAVSDIVKAPAADEAKPASAS